MTHVFHLAAQAGVRKSWGRDFQIYTANNIEATQVLLEACVGRPIEQLVYASSSSVYGDDAPHPDARGRAAAPAVALRRDQARRRAACATSTPPTTACRPRAVRYFTVYGPRQRPDMGVPPLPQGRASTAQPITVFGDGEQTRDFTFVGDAVAATIAAAERGVPGRAYNIGGGSRVSVNEVLDMIAAITRPAARHRARAGAEGRHARHLRRHVARARRPRLRARRFARRRPGGRVSLACFDLPCTA